MIYLPKSQAFSTLHKEDKQKSFELSGINILYCNTQIKSSKICTPSTICTVMQNPKTAVEDCQGPSLILDSRIHIDALNQLRVPWIAS